MMKNGEIDSTQKAHQEKSSSPVGFELKRRVGLLSSVGLIIGNIIGSGIFISPGVILLRAGSVGLSLVLWAACGLLAIFGSLSYAELGTLIPKSGGEYSYYMNCFGPLHRFWGPLPGFLYSWLAVLFLSPSSLAVGCLSSASYTIYPIIKSLDICLNTEIQEMLVKITAVLYIGLVTSIHCYNVNWAVRAQNVFTFAKLLALVILIGCGIYQLIGGKTQYLAQGFEGSTTEFGTIATAFYGGLWAYDGWNNLNFITEELKDPYVTLPRAIIIGIPLVTVFYLLANIAYLTVLSPQMMAESNAVAVDVGRLMLGPLAFLIPLFVAMSTIGTVLATAFANSRACFAAARGGHLIGVLSYVHVDSCIPVPALLFNAIVASFLVSSKTITNLIDFCVFAYWIFYVTAIVVLLILRKTRPDAPRPYRVPLFIPILFLIIESYLIIAPIVTDPVIEYLFVIGALVIGFVVYIPFVYYKISLGCLGWITNVVQLTFRVAPTFKSLED